MGFDAPKPKLESSARLNSIAAHMFQLISFKTQFVLFCSLQDLFAPTVSHSFFCSSVSRQIEKSRLHPEARLNFQTRGFGQDELRHFVSRSQDPTFLTLALS